MLKTSKNLWETLKKTQVHGEMYGTHGSEYFTWLKMPISSYCGQSGNAQWNPAPSTVWMSRLMMPHMYQRVWDYYSHKEVFWEEQGSLPKEGRMAWKNGLRILWCLEDEACVRALSTGWSFVLLTSCWCQRRQHLGFPDSLSRCGTER